MALSSVDTLVVNENYNEYEFVEKDDLKTYPYSSDLSTNNKTIIGAINELITSDTNITKDATRYTFNVGLNRNDDPTLKQVNTIITVENNNPANYGLDVAIGSGQMLVVGSGESGIQIGQNFQTVQNTYTSLGTDLDESLLLASDKNIVLTPGYNNSDLEASRAKSLVFSSAGNLWNYNWKGTGNNLLYCTDDGQVAEWKSRSVGVISNFCNNYALKTDNPDVRVATGSSTLLQSITLTKGTWMIEMLVRFQETDTSRKGYRKVYWNFDNTTSAQYGLISTAQSPYSPTDHTCVRATAIIRAPNDSQVFYMRGTHDAGITLTVQPSAKIVRLCSD